MTSIIGLSPHAYAGGPASFPTGLGRPAVQLQDKPKHWTFDDEEHRLSKKRNRPKRQYYGRQVKAATATAKPKITEDDILSSLNSLL